MENYPKVPVADLNLTLRTFKNNLKKFDFLESIPTNSDYELQDIIDLRSQLSWIRSKLSHLKSWNQNGDEDVKEVDINDLENEVVLRRTKVKICEKVTTMCRDTFLYTSFLKFEDIYKQQTWKQQVSKLLTISANLAGLHRDILLHTKRKNEALRSFINAKAEFVNACEKYVSILNNRREEIIENQDNEVLATVMLKDKINLKRKEIKVVNHLIQGIVGLSWMYQPRQTKNIDRLLEIAYNLPT